MTTVYFDLETGGLLPRHPTIQLAAVAVRDGVEVSAFEQKIAFNEADADPEALKMNHYNADAWADAITPAVTVARFADWIRPYCDLSLTSKRTGKPYQVARLAGYNALTFDLPRLRALFGDQFTPWDPRVRDVLQRALFWFDERPHKVPPDNYRLATVCEWFEIDTDGAHGALADARMCAALARRLQDGN